MTPLWLGQNRVGGKTKDLGRWSLQAGGGSLGQGVARGQTEAVHLSTFQEAKSCGGGRWGGKAEPRFLDQALG